MIASLLPVVVLALAVPEAPAPVSPAASPASAGHPAVDAGDPSAAAPTKKTGRRLADLAQLRLFLAGSPVDGFIVVSDSHFSASTIFGAGLEGDALLHLGRFVRIGLGLRYEMVFTSQTKPHRLFSLPLLVGARIPLASGRELEALLGYGIMGGALYGGEGAGGGDALRIPGLCAEASLTYWFPVGDRVDLALGGALRVGEFKVENGAGYFQGSSGLHVFVPFRVGLRWRS